MAEKVGELYYDVTLDTAKMIDGQRKVDREIGKTTGTLDRFEAKVTAVAAAVGILAAAMAAVNAAKAADEFRLLEARVNVAAGSLERGAEAMKALQDISTRTQTSLEANADVFGRLNQSILQMGGTQQDTLRLTELLGMAIKVSGASAVEAKSAMLQFGQALGSGKLAGDELRSLLENAPYLMRQLADGLGVPIGALKKMGEEGKLTADVVVAAMGKAAGKIEADFATFPQTIGASMEVVRNNVQRANKAFDDMTGGSAKLSGVAQGLGTVIGELADQFTDATTESDKLGRNQEVKSWADTTATILTYVIDSADGVVRVFQHIGKALGGMAAAATAVASGEFTLAKNIVAELDKDLDDLWARQLSGAKIRDKIAAAGGVKALGGTFSALKPPGGGDGKKKKGAKFDSAAYLSDLRKAQSTEMGVINETETEKLRVAKQNLDQKKISEAQYQEAVTLITAAAEQDRVKLREKAQKEIDDDRKRSDKEVEQALEERKRKEKEAVDYVANLTRAVNPIDALRQEYEAKLQLVTQYEQLMAQAGVDATEQGQITRTQITNEYELQRQALAEQSFRSQSDANAFMMDSVNALSSTATSSILGLIEGTMTAQEAMHALAGTVLNEAVSALVQIGFQQIKNALIGDTIAAADKAKKAANGAVYMASVSAQVAGMTSMAALNAFAATAAIPIIGPALAPAAAAAAAAAASALGAPAIATAPIAGARQYGGPVSPGSLYRINETGAPEMFTGSNGNQYMLPNKSGQVTPADQVGGGGGWTININEAPPGTTATVNEQARTIDIAVGRAVGEVAGQISSNSGPVWSAMRSSSDIKPRM